MELTKIIFKFIIGGAIISGVTVLTKYIHPKWGGLIATAPIITTLSVIFVYLESNTTLTRQLILSSIYFVIPTLFFLIALYLLLSRFNLLNSLIIAYLVWLGVAYIIQLLIPPNH